MLHNNLFSWKIPTYSTEYHIANKTDASTDNNILSHTKFYFI